MTSPGAVRLAVGAVIAAIIAMTAAGLYWIAITPRSELPIGFRLEELAAYSLIQVAFGAMGALLAVRRSRNPIGWLFLATAVLSAWLQMSSGYALNAIVDGRSTGPLVAWIYNMSAGLLLAPLIPAIVVFPDGKAATRSGRMLLWLTPVNLAAAAFLAIRPGPLLNMPAVQNPYPLALGGPALVATAVFLVAAFLLFPALVVHDLVTRIRAARGALAQQLKWLVWSAILIIASVLVAGSLAILLAESPSGGLVTYLARIVFAIVVSTLPVALGLAIVRYHLYDIDLVIRRTLVYATLTALSGLTYVVLVVLFQAALRPFTAGSDLAVAASTLVVVALFQPIRHRLGDFVDRRFYRSRYDAVRTLDSFGARLRDEVELDAVRADLVGVVHETIRPAHASVWLRQPHG